MAKAIAYELNENQAEKLESLIDETLRALNNLEANSRERDRRVEESQRRTAQTLDYTESVLNEIATLNSNRKTFKTIFS